MGELALKQPSSGGTRLDAVAAVTVGVLGGAYRFLAHVGFTNDHFVHLARAQAWLAGDWPFRDFEEPGAILTVGLSAAAQALAGESLLTELVLDVAALGLAAAVTCWLATRVTGRLALGILAAALQIAIAPRLYGYPKILVFPVAILLLDRYAAKPTRSRLVAAAAWVAVSLLLRHDYGIYTAAAAALTLLAVHRRDGAIRAARQVGVCAALVLAFVLPFLIYVQATVGLWTYARRGAEIFGGEAARIRTGLPRFVLDGEPLLVRQPAGAGDLPRIHIRWAPHVDERARLAHERAAGLLHAEQIDERTWRYRVGWDAADALAPLLARTDVDDVEGVDRRTLELDTARPFWTSILDAAGLSRWRVNPPTRLLSDNAPPFLFYTAWVLPFAAVLLWMGRLKAASSSLAVPTSIIVPVVCALGLLCVAGFQRNEPAVRTPEVFGTFPILFTWVLAALVTAPARRWRTLCRVVVVALTIAVCSSVASFGQAGDMLERTTVFGGPGSMMARAGAVARSAREWPHSVRRPGDAGWTLARYVHGCTQPGDRLLVTWFAPEYYVLSRRPFAGRETVLMPLYRSPASYEPGVLETWTRQSVPIVLAEARTFPDFIEAYPALSRHIAERYRRIGAVQSNSGPIDVFVERDRVPSGTDAELGWDCFTAAAP